MKRGDDMIRAAFRALAQRDDRGNWARRFADSRLIESFMPGYDDAPEQPQGQNEKALKAALSKFVGGGYLVFKDDYYDISHEALIRNWKQYQEWLRDPEEISRALVRAVAEINPASLEPSTSAAEDNLLSNLPRPLCNTLNKIFKERLLPRSWAKEQIAPMLNRQDIANRWQTKAPDETLEKLETLVNRSQAVRNRQTHRQLLKNIAIAAAVPILIAAFAMWQTHQANKTTSTIRAKSIALHAEDALEYRGPTQALLIAMQAEKAGLPDIPETEQVMYKALRQLREKRALHAPGPSVMNASVNPTGTVVVGVTPGGLIQFWRTVDGEPIDSYQLEIKGPGQTFGIKWSPDGERLAIGAGERTAIVTPCTHPKLRALFAACSSTSQDVNWLGGSGVQAGPGKFSRDSKFLVTGNWRAKARLWNLDTYTYEDLGVETAFPWAVALSPDMQNAAIGTNRGTIQIVDLKTRQVKEMKLGETESSAVTSVDFGNDPKLLLAATQDGKLWLLDLATRICVQVPGQSGIAFQTAFSRDGRRIATASDDRALRIWPADRINDPPFVLKGHEGPIYSVQFTDDGNGLISASPDGTVRIWSVDGALHYEMSPMHQPIYDDRSPINSGDDREVDRAEADGYTVVAYSGPHRHLALFEPGQPTAPIAEWGERIHANWRSVGLKPRDPSKKDGLGTITAVATTGETYTWPYFANVAALIKFAKANLPSVGSAKLRLSDLELCKLNLAELTRVPQQIAQPASASCQEPGE